MFGTGTIVLQKYKMAKKHSLSVSQLEKVATAARTLGHVDAKYFSVPDLTSRKDKDNFGVGHIVQMARDAVKVLPPEEEIREYCKTFAKYGLTEEEGHLRGRYASLRSASRLD